jgi:hypothetical protein
MDAQVWKAGCQFAFTDATGDTYTKDCAEPGHYTIEYTTSRPELVLVECGPEVTAGWIGWVRDKFAGQAAALLGGITFKKFKEPDDKLEPDKFGSKIVEHIQLGTSKPIQKLMLYPKEFFIDPFLVDTIGDASSVQTLKIEHEVLYRKVGDASRTLLPNSRFGSVPDADVTECESNSCSTAFGYSVRRHHCRSCGHVFCSACSKKRFDLKDEMTKKSTRKRVCDECFQKLEHVGYSSLTDSDGSSEKPQSDDAGSASDSDDSTGRDSSRQARRSGSRSPRRRSRSGSRRRSSSS